MPTMPTQNPQIDPRTFQDLIDSAWDRIGDSCRAWTDHSPGDPGVALLEMFAHLTELMIYRLNRLPDKAYVEFLRLMGVRLSPPGASGVALRFMRATANAPAGAGAAPVASRRIEIPSGTAVAGSAGGADSPVFVTLKDAVIEAGADWVEVDAIHAENIDGELAGPG